MSTLDKSLYFLTGKYFFEENVTREEENGHQLQKLQWGVKLMMRRKTEEERGSGGGGTFSSQGWSVNEPLLSSQLPFSGQEKKLNDHFLGEKKKLYKKMIWTAYRQDVDLELMFVLLWLETLKGLD